MTRPVSGAGVAAAAALSAAAFLATNAYASCLASAGGDPVGAASAALSQLPGHLLSRGLSPDPSAGPVAAGVAAACGVWSAWAWRQARSTAAPAGRRPPR